MGHAGYVGNNEVVSEEVEGMFKNDSTKKNDLLRFRVWKYPLLLTYRVISRL